MLQVTLILSSAVSSRWILDPCYGFVSSPPPGGTPWMDPGPGSQLAGAAAEPRCLPLLCPLCSDPVGLRPVDGDAVPGLCCCRTQAVRVASHNSGEECEIPKRDALKVFKGCSRLGSLTNPRYLPFAFLLYSPPWLPNLCKSKSKPETRCSGRQENPGVF